MDVEFSCAHCANPRPTVLRLVHTFSSTCPHVQQSNVSSGLRILLVTLDLFHRLIRMLHTFVPRSAGFHVAGICAQRELLTLQEIFHEQETKLDVLLATKSHFRML